MVVEVAGEGEGETFVEAFLVEKKCFFKWSQVASYYWGTGEEDGGFNFVGGAV